MLAIIGAVVGEYLGGNQGLGNLAVKEMNSYNTTALFAVIIHLSLLGFIFYALVVGRGGSSSRGTNPFKSTAGDANQISRRSGWWQLVQRSASFRLRGLPN